MMREGWKATPVAALATYWNGYPFKPDELGDEGLPVVRIRQLLDPTAEFDRFAGMPRAENRIDSGDLVFSWSGTLGCRVWERGPAVLNQHLFRCDPARGIAPAWLSWALRWALREFEPYMHGSAMRHITRPMMKAVSVPTPPKDEQLRIAGFLDREYDRIAELSQHLGLLECRLNEMERARFTALVGAASPVPLRRIALSVSDGPFGSSLASKHYVDPPGVRVVRLGNIGLAEPLLRDAAYVDSRYAGSELAQHRLLTGEVVVAGLGDSAQPLGRAFAVPPELEGAIHKADCFRVRLQPAQDAAYVAWALTYGPAREVALLLSRGTTRSRLNTDVIRDLPVPLLDRGQQTSVAETMARHRQQSRNLVRAVRSATDSLAEYGSSLIAEAVTGQLDVSRLSDAQLDESARAASEGERPEVLSA